MRRHLNTPKPPNSCKVVLIFGLIGAGVWRWVGQRDGWQSWLRLRSLRCCSSTSTSQRQLEDCIRCSGGWHGSEHLEHISVGRKTTAGHLPSQQHPPSSFPYWEGPPSHFTLKKYITFYKLVYTLLPKNKSRCCQYKCGLEVICRFF